MNIFQKIFSDSRLPFIVLTLAAIVWLVCLPLFQDGMFMDGVQYAAVARNLAKGIGTFWFPVFSENYVAGLNSFHEHPPLVYFLQSIFFKIFGLNNIYPERIYDLFMLLLTAGLISLIWKHLNKSNKSISKHYWLPVLFWIVMPVVFWSFSNNIHELTMGVFTTAAVYFFLLSIDNNNGNSHKQFYFLLGSIFIVAAFLCKGIPGLFPLVFFGFHYIVFRKISFQKCITATLLVIVILGISAGIFLLIPEAKTSLRIWLVDRMLYRIANNPVYGSHFHILQGLITEQFPSVAIVLLIFFWNKIQKNDTSFSKNNFLFFILIGLSASLPLMLTKVQRDFYFIPALPFFALAWASLVADGMNKIVEKLKEHKKAQLAITTIIAIVFLGGIVTTYLKAGKIKRHKAQLEDVYYLKKKLSLETNVCVPAEIMWNDWSFRSYMMRYNDISFVKADTCKYYITLKNQKQPIEYKIEIATLNKYKLYKTSEY